MSDSSSSSSKIGDKSLSPMEAFIEYATADLFTEKIDSWMDEHCEGFENANIEEEQSLEWGRTYSEYLDWFEDQLEGYCRREDLEHSDIADALKEATTADNRSGAKFLPVFMLNTVYANFLLEMKARAREKIAEKQARDAKASVSEGAPVVNISGVWYNDPPRSSEEKTSRKKKLFEIMKLVGLPWMFQRLFASVASSRHIRIIVEQDSESICITTKFRFFGSAITFLKWGAPTRVYNFWRKQVTCTAFVDRDMVRMNMANVDYYPKGSKVCHTWSFEEDDDDESSPRLVLTLGVDLPDGKSHRLPFYFASERRGK